MSYDISVYIGDQPFPEAAYRAFVANSLRIRGDWQYLEIQPVTVDAESKMHEYQIGDRQDIFDDDHDRMPVSVWVDLYRRKPESCVPPFERFTHVVSVETGQDDRLFRCWCSYWLLRPCSISSTTWSWKTCRATTPKACPFTLAKQISWGMWADFA